MDPLELASPEPVPPLAERRGLSVRDPQESAVTQWGLRVLGIPVSGQSMGRVRSNRLGVPVQLDPLGPNRYQ